MISQLESVEANQGNLGRRYTKLEEKYVDMEKDKESRVNQVEELHLLLLEQKEKVNELQPKLKAPYKFTNSLEVIKNLRTKPMANDGLVAGFNKFFCGNKKLSSCVVLENNGSKLGKDSKWNVVEASFENDICSNHYAPSSLKSGSSLNHFNSKGKSAEDFVWKIKSNSNQNST